MRTEEEMVAYALETHPSLLPYIPELLADLEELGSDAGLIARVIGDLGLPGSASVIDLGCGKGATAVKIAGTLGLEVLGIELFEPFVRSCEALAAQHGVSGRCRFVHGDILKLAGQLPPADVVVFAALGDVLGRLDETIAVLRRYVRSGGFIVISDAFIREGGSADFPGFENYARHEATLARLTAWGDSLVREVLESVEPGEDDEDGDDEADLILSRARALAARHPEMAADLLEFAANQSAENNYIDTNLTGAIWVLERA